MFNLTKNGYRDLLINDDDYILQCDYESIFGGFAEATALLSGQKYATAALIIPLFESLRECVLPRPAESVKGRLLRSSLKKSFEHYMAKYKFLSTPLLSAITFLDPRYI